MDIKKLEEKYKAGETTLAEEEELFQHWEASNSELSAWFKYAKHTKQQTSPLLKGNIWNTIQKKTVRVRMMVFAAAASILLVAIFSIINLKEDRLSYQEKEAKLQEAIALVSEIEEEFMSENVIYEDELVIIYTTAE